MATCIHTIAICVRAVPHRVAVEQREGWELRACAAVRGEWK